MAHFGSCSRKMSKSTTVRLSLFSSLSETPSVNSSPHYMNHKHRLRSSTHSLFSRCTPRSANLFSGGRGVDKHPMMTQDGAMCVTDNFFFVVIKAVVKWPVCSLRGLFSNTQSRWYVFFMDESLIRVGFV